EPAGALRIDSSLINQELFNDHRRQQSIALDLFRIDDHHALDGRKPQPAIPGLPGGGLKTAVTLIALHAILEAIGGGSNRLEPARGKFIELPPADAEDAFIATHPETAGPIFENRE